MQEIVGTCGDRLSDLHGKVHKIKIVIGYEIDGLVYKYWQDSFSDIRTLQKANPVFEEFNTWKKFISSKAQLDYAAQLRKPYKTYLILFLYARK